MGSADWRERSVKLSFYDWFLERENVPVYGGNFVDNVYTLELADWPRVGGKGAYLSMANQQVTNGHVVEIAPGGQLKPERHLFEKIVYVLSGNGATQVWWEDGKRLTFEWQAGSFFAIPLNANHQHFNGSGTEPARLMGATTMPQALNQYHNLEFVFDNPQVFSDRWSAAIPDFFNTGGTHRNFRLHETNFIPDVRAFALDPSEDRGRRAELMRLAMGSSSIGVHLMSVSEGTYVTAHRHFAGPHVIVVEGSGYEIFFMPGEEARRQRVEANPFTVIAPRHNEFHQHFNTGHGPYRMLAFTPFPAKYGMGRSYDPKLTSRSDNPHSWTYMIPFEDEDPAIRAEYYAELAGRGIDLQLEPLRQSG